MCGRYSLLTPAKVIAEVFRTAMLFEHRERFNIAPTQKAPIIRGCSENESREAVMMRWGLIPSWAKDAAIGNRLINARIETADAKPAFRSAWKHRRCLVLADGFYEWKPAGKAKQPFHVRLPGLEPFAFAGLWESWIADAGDCIESYTILTCEAGENLRSLHDRMPVAIPADSYGLWLSGQAIDCPSLIDSAHNFAKSLEVQPVSRVVNSPKNDSPACIEPPQA